MTPYIVHKIFNKRAICGAVNLAAGTACQEVGGVLYTNGKPLCMAASENAHQYFARNDDGQGLLRGQLTQSIQERMKNQNHAWDFIVEDAVCLKYKRVEHADHWLWNHEFFGASIEDLQYISDLVDEAIEKGAALDAEEAALAALEAAAEEPDQLVE